MAGDVDRSARDLLSASQREAVLTARAQRRLVEFELTRRRTLLWLSVALCNVGVILALVGELYAGAPLVTAAVAAAAGAGPRRDQPR